MKKRPFALVLCIALLFGVMPIPGFAAGEYVDVSEEDWAFNQIEKWSGLGILNGYGAHFFAQNSISRGEMAVIFDRLMNYQKKASNTFTDLPSGIFYTEAILAANKAGIMQGDGYHDGYTVRPKDAITREEAAAMIGRALEIADTKTVSFADKAEISDWAMPFVSGLAGVGILNGRPGGVFDPKAFISRAEVVTIVDNAIKGFYYKSGTYTDSVKGFALVNTPGVVLENMEVNGDLIIAEGVGTGETTLDNVVVNGRMIVRGGGVNSIIIKGTSSVGTVIVQNKDNAVSVKVEGDADVEVIYVNDGVDEVFVNGNIGGLVIGAETTVNIAGGTVGSLAVEGENSTVIVAQDATIEKLTVNAGAEITNDGKVADLEVNVNDVVFDGNKPTNVTVDDKVENAPVDKGGNEVTSGGSTSGGGGGSSGTSSTPTPTPTQTQSEPTVAVSGITSSSATLTASGGEATVPNKFWFYVSASDVVPQITATHNGDTTAVLNKWCSDADNSIDISGLTPNTAYYVWTYREGDSTYLNSPISARETFTTLADSPSTPTPPAAPNATSVAGTTAVNATTISGLVASTSYEYVLDTNPTLDATNFGTPTGTLAGNASAWTNLDAGANTFIHIRVAADGATSTPAGEIQNLALNKAVAGAAVPDEVASVAGNAENATTITGLTAATTYEYILGNGTAPAANDAAWTGAPFALGNAIIWTNLNAGAHTHIYIRVKASAGVIAGAIKDLTLNKAEAGPAAPNVSSAAGATVGATAINIPTGATVYEYVFDNNATLAGDAAAWTGASDGTGDALAAAWADYATPSTHLHIRVKANGNVLAGEVKDIELVKNTTVIPTTYSVSGTVTLGAVDVVVVTVELKNETTTTVKTETVNITTGTTGAYEFADVDDGTYTMEVSASGYATVTIPSFTVNGDVSGKNATIYKIPAAPNAISGIGGVVGTTTITGLTAATTYEYILGNSTAPDATAWEGAVSSAVGNDAVWTDMVASTNTHIYIRVAAINGGAPAGEVQTLPLTIAQDPVALTMTASLPTWTGKQTTDNPPAVIQAAEVTLAEKTNLGFTPTANCKYYYKSTTGTTIPTTLVKNGAIPVGDGYAELVIDATTGDAKLAVGEYIIVETNSADEITRAGYVEVKADNIAAIVAINNTDTDSNSINAWTLSFDVPEVGSGADEIVANDTLYILIKSGSADSITLTNSASGKSKPFSLSFTNGVCTVPTGNISEWP